MMNTDERIQFEKEVGLDAGKDYNLLSKVNVNWLDEVFNDAAPLQSYELSVNRATDRLNYYVSGGFYDQDGIAQNSTFRRYNIRTNADVKASNWLKIGTNTMAAYEEAQQADDGSYTTVTPISACRFMLPYWNPYARMAVLLLFQPVTGLVRARTLSYIWERILSRTRSIRFSLLCMQRFILLRI